jgi:hypothetical protein
MFVWKRVWLQVLFWLHSFWEKKIPSLIIKNDRERDAMVRAPVCNSIVRSTEREMNTVWWKWKIDQWVTYFMLLCVEILKCYACSPN